MREAEVKIGEFVERKVAAEDQLKRIDIRAPQDGTVHQSTAHTVGGVVTAGDPIMLIVPDTDTLMVEAKVQPQDIDQLQLGQKAVLRFPPSTSARRPSSTARSSHVAADLTREAQTGTGFYVARIKPTAELLAKFVSLKLVPGIFRTGGGDRYS